MTPRTPKPRPVEAWALFWEGKPDYMACYDGMPGFVTLPLAVYGCRAECAHELDDSQTMHRVRIVPIVNRKPRTKRKEKKK